MHRHRVGPVEFGELGVTHRQVPGEAIVQMMLCKGTAGRHQMLFAVLALAGQIAEYRSLRKQQAGLFGLVYRSCAARWSLAIDSLHKGFVGIGVQTIIQQPAVLRDNGAPEQPA